MALLDLPFDEIPDEVQPISPGIYTLEITEVPEVMPTKDGTGTKIVVQFAVADEGQFKGRRIQDHISTKMQTQVKRLFLAAGIRPTSAGVDTEELLGRQVRARLISRTYTNDMGEEVETVRIRDYLLPQEA